MVVGSPVAVYYTGIIEFQIYLLLFNRSSTFLPIFVTAAQTIIKICCIVFLMTLYMNVFICTYVVWQGMVYTDKE